MQSVGLFAASALPFLALPFLRGTAQIFAAVAAATAIALEAAVAVIMETSPVYALMHPFGALLFDYMLLRSTAVTLWQGGVTWRDTFYSLDELRRGGA